MKTLTNKKCVPQRYALSNLCFTNFFVENIITIIIIIIIVIIIINDLLQLAYSKQYLKHKVLND